MVECTDYDNKSIHNLAKTSDNNSKHSANINATCGFGASRIELLSSPACHKRPLMEVSKGFPAGAIPSVVKV